ncbi:MAG: acetyl-CoA carboxylase carboxyltransferase subunit alpha [Clostridia bacterium]
MPTAYERVQTARSKNRPTGLSYIQNIFTDFIELHGDRRFSDDKAIVGGLAQINGKTCTVIAIEKGTDTKERLKRNFGMPYPEGYRKALRLMKQAEKFKRPVITFIDTSGAFCGIGAEERGQGLAIAENLLEMISLKTPVIAVLIGEGGSGGALALAVADRVWIMENAVYSVVSPEGCASILWKDSKKADEAAEVLKITAEDMKNFGVVEKVIEEEKDFSKVYENLKESLFAEIEEIQKETTEEMLEKRYNRFRKF